MRRRSLLLVGLLGGCSLVPQAPYVQRRDWPLDLRRPAMARPKARWGVLMVRTVQAAPGLEARGLQWLEPDGSVHVDFYEQWAVPPAQAAENGLRQWLADAGLFRAVVAPGSRLEADYVLEGELTELMANLKAGTARASLSLVLLDQRRASPKVLLQRTETAEVKLPGSEPPQIAEALQAALTQVMARTETDVAAATR